MSEPGALQLPDRGFRFLMLLEHRHEFRSSFASMAPPMDAILPSVATKSINASGKWLCELNHPSQATEKPADPDAAARR